MVFIAFSKCPHPIKGFFVFKGDGCPAFNIILLVLRKYISVVWAKLPHNIMQTFTQFSAIHLITAFMKGFHMLEWELGLPSNTVNDILSNKHPCCANNLNQILCTRHVQFFVIPWKYYANSAVIYHYLVENAINIIYLLHHVYDKQSWPTIIHLISSTLK